MIKKMNLLLVTQTQFHFSNRFNENAAKLTVIVGYHPSINNIVDNFVHYTWDFETLSETFLPEEVFTA